MMLELKKDSIPVVAQAATEALYEGEIIGNKLWKAQIHRIFKS